MGIVPEYIQEAIRSPTQIRINSAGMTFSILMAIAFSICGQVTPHLHAIIPAMMAAAIRKGVEVILPRIATANRPSRDRIGMTASHSFGSRIWRAGLDFGSFFGASFFTEFSSDITFISTLKFFLLQMCESSEAYIY